MKQRDRERKRALERPWTKCRPKKKVKKETENIETQRGKERENRETKRKNQEKLTHTNKTKQ